MVSTLLKSVDFHVHFVVVLTDKTTNGPSSKKSKNEKKKGKNFGNEKENVSWFINFCFVILLLFSFCFVCLLVRLFVFFFFSEMACTQLNDFPENHRKSLA